jgi:hypothetical protein
LESSSPLERILDVLAKVNVPSVDNGVQFTVSDRIEAVRSILAGSLYRELKADGVSYIFAHESFDPSEETFIISCHADAVYQRYFCKDTGEDELLGTLDNSICNAVLLECMIRGALPGNWLVAFTGDEEDLLRGADETAEYLISKMKLEGRLGFALVLDVTAEGYDSQNYTVENLFVSEDQSHARRFTDVKALEDHIRTIVGDEVLAIPDAAEDEAWGYDEWDLNCISLCIPVRPAAPAADEYFAHWMHSDEGIAVKKSAVVGYSRALEMICIRLPG